jgi:hypothetical protein
VGGGNYVGFVAINVQQPLMDGTVHWQMQQLQLELQYQPCASIPNVKGWQPPLLKKSWSWQPPLFKKS